MTQFETVQELGEFFRSEVAEGDVVSVECSDGEFAGEVYFVYRETDDAGVLQVDVAVRQDSKEIWEMFAEIPVSDSAGEYEFEGILLTAKKREVVELGSVESVVVE